MIRRTVFIAASVAVCCMLSSIAMTSSAMAACESIKTFPFAKEGEVKSVVIANCAAFEVTIEVKDDNESLFKLASPSKCNESTLKPEGAEGDSCTESVTFTGKCECPKMKATFEVTVIRPGEKKFTKELEGC